MLHGLYLTRRDGWCRSRNPGVAGVGWLVWGGCGVHPGFSPFHDARPGRQEAGWGNGAGARRRRSDAAAATPWLQRRRGGAAWEASFQTLLSPPRLLCSLLCSLLSLFISPPLHNPARQDGHPGASADACLPAGFWLVGLLACLLNSCCAAPAPCLWRASRSQARLRPVPSRGCSRSRSSRPPAASS